MIFGFVLPLVTALIGLIVSIRFDAASAARVIWAFGAVLTCTYVAVPRWRRPIFVGWMYMTYPIGWILSHAVLLIVFLVVIVPFGLIARVARRDLLARRLDPSTPSYWTQRKPASDVRRYFRQS